MAYRYVRKRKTGYVIVNKAGRQQARRQDAQPTAQALRPARL